MEVKYLNSEINQNEKNVDVVDLFFLLGDILLLEFNEKYVI